MRIPEPKYKIVIGVHQDGKANVDWSDPVIKGYTVTPRAQKRLIKLARKMASVRIMNKSQVMARIGAMFSRLIDGVGK